MGNQHCHLFPDGEVVREDFGSDRDGSPVRREKLQGVRAPDVEAVLAWSYDRIGALGRLKIEVFLEGHDVQIMCG